MAGSDVGDLMRHHPCQFGFVIRFEDEAGLDKEESAGEGEEGVSEEDEELVQKCIEIMRQEKKASTSLFQRRLRLGYTRAARVVDILEQRGYVAPGEGAKPREILKDLDTLAL